MKLRVRADPYARLVGQYTALTLRGDYVGTAPEFLSLSDVRECLQSRGYEPAPSIGPVPLEAAKLHPDTGDSHDLALRKVAEPKDDHHASAIHADHAEHCQYHVHGWRTPEGVELHSHFEWRPDPHTLVHETPADAYHRLRSHYRPGSYGGGAYLRRVHDDAVAQLG